MCGEGGGGVQLMCLCVVKEGFWLMCLCGEGGGGGRLTMGDWYVSMCVVKGGGGYG